MNKISFVLVGAFVFVIGFSSLSSSSAFGAESAAPAPADTVVEAKSATEVQAPAPEPAHATLAGSRNPILPKKPEKFGAFYSMIMRSMTSTGEASNPSRFELKSGDLQVHAFGLRYALTDRWAIRLSDAYVKTNWRMAIMGEEATLDLDGLGDAKIQAVGTLYKDLGHWLETSFGMTLATASIDREMDGEVLPATAQLGSGTHDLEAKMMYAYNTEKFIFSQAIDTIVRTGQSSREYRLGNVFTMSGSVSYMMFPFFSPVIGYRYSDKKPMVDNSTPKITTASSGSHSSTSTANRLSPPGSTWEGSVGVRSYIPLGSQSPFKLSVEAGAPFYTGSSSGSMPLKTAWYGNMNLSAAF